MKKIFIADDDLDILEILKLMLETKGYQVETSVKAQEIFSGSADSADLIILDLWMAGADGRDIFNQLRSNKKTKHIPVVFMSASSELESIAAEFKVDGYIAKPFDMQDMLKTVHDLVTNAS